MRSLPPTLASLLLLAAGSARAGAPRLPSPEALAAMMSDNTAAPSPAASSVAAARTDDVHPASAGRMAGATIGAVVLSGVVSVLAAGVAGAVPTIANESLLTNENSAGPSPHFATSLALGGVVGVPVGAAVTYGMLPKLLATFADDDRDAGSVAAARDEGWRRGRWWGLGIAAGLGTVVAGDTLLGGDASNATIAVGAGIALVSYAIAYVQAVRGAVHGYQRTRRRR